MPDSTSLPRLEIEYPPWVAHLPDWEREHPDDTARMQVAIRAAAANVQHGTGGPFGAAVFEQRSGRLLALGMNLVVRYNNALLHAETLAFMMAQARVGAYTLHRADLPACELFTSCEPCAMCLGAVLWSGVQRVVWGALREDAHRIAFDEGPVFPASYDYLRQRGIVLRGGFLRAEARAVLERYRAQSGIIYNG